jgi:hypothetical protein
LATLELALTAFFRVEFGLLRAALVGTIFLRSLLILKLHVLRWLGRSLISGEIFLGRFALAAILRSLAIFRRATSKLWAIIGWLKESTSSDIIIIVVNGLNLEASGVIGLEGGQAAVSHHLERAGFTLRKSDVDVLLFTNG